MKKRKKALHAGDNRVYTLMMLPALLLLFVFSYLPMGGIVIAFQDYKHNKGIFGSKFIGFDNFEFFFKSSDAWRITRNTLGMNFLFIFIGMAVAVGLALLMNEVASKKAVKVYQTSMILPNFVSWVIAGYMVYAILNPRFGLLNQVLKNFGIDMIDWYAKPNAWPAILTISGVWKSAGMNCIVYYAALVSIDDTYYEAATLDGATKWQMATKISIPLIIPTITIMFILSLGGIFRSDFGMFYQLPRNVGKLYSTTDVIDTYVVRALTTNGDVGMSAAVGLFQSIVGFITVIVANWVVKKVEPDNAMF